MHLDRVSVPDDERSTPTAGSGKASSRPTLEDVAALARVSQSAVSLLLKGHKDVCSPETARRIYSAITELQYVPPRAAARRHAGAVEEFDADTLLAAGHFNLSASGGAGGHATKVMGGARGIRRSGPVTIGLCLRAPRRPFVPTEAPSLQADPGFFPLRSAMPDTTGKEPSAISVQTQLIDEILLGIREAADQKEVRLLLFPYEASVGRQYEPFLDGSISGLILVSGYPDTRLTRLVERGLPVVVTQFFGVPQGCGKVFTIEGNTVNLAMSHLWSLGHRRIAYLVGPGGLNAADQTSRRRSRLYDTKTELLNEIRRRASEVTIRRLDRYIHWMETRGAFDPHLIAITHAWDSRSHLRGLLASWQELPDPPTAVFCGHEGAAINLLRAAQAAGLRVPEDLSIVGVDTNAGHMGMTTPGLTSVEIPAQNIGQETVHTLLRMLRHQGDAEETESDTEGDTEQGESAEEEEIVERDILECAVPVKRLRVRGSTAPPHSTGS
jgi:DNA-binding LacI/PurR family transcriptional regulator